MNALRNQAAARIFSLFTGVIFLNMSFFLAEVCMLEFNDDQMVENVCQLVLNAGFEEERDSHSSGSPDSALKVFGMTADALLSRHSSLFLIANKMHQEFEDHYVPADHSEKFSPPPEVGFSLISVAV